MRIIRSTLHAFSATSEPGKETVCSQPKANLPGTQ